MIIVRLRERERGGGGGVGARWSVRGGVKSEVFYRWDGGGNKKGLGRDEDLEMEWREMVRQWNSWRNERGVAAHGKNTAIYLLSRDERETGEDREFHIVPDEKWLNS